MRAVAGAGLVIVALAAAASAQPAPPGPPATAPLDAAARQAIVARLAADLREEFADPDAGTKAADRLTANLRSGAYDGLTDPAQFARRLDDDLYPVVPAEHLHVIVPGAPLLWDSGPNEFGVVRADRLRGGVGYVEVVSFPPMELFKPAIDRAMKALAGSKALIIDDRNNGGGNSLSEAYLASFVVPHGKIVHIDELVTRRRGTDSFTRQPLDSQPTPVSFAGRPVYVLTSHQTFSAGEGLAYNLQALGLAKVVGEVTAGGAELQPGDVDFSFFSSGEPLAAGLQATVPSLRSQNPTTHGNWEGQGVRPDIEAPASGALGAALAKLGQPDGMDLAAAPEKQVFAPRTAQAPGTEAALRRFLQAKTPDYAGMTCGFGDIVRSVQGHDPLAGLGPIEAVHFREFDGNGDEYDVVYPAVTARFSIALAADGRICQLRMWPPVPNAKPAAGKAG